MSIENTGTQKSELGEIDHDLSICGNWLALLGGGQEPILPNGGYGFLVQSKAKSALNANLFRQSIFTHHHRNDGHLHERVGRKRVSKIGVNRVDRVGLC